MEDAIIVACFGSNDIAQFNKTFKEIYSEINSKANAATALALLNIKIAERVNELHIKQVIEDYKEYRNVYVVPLLLADGTTYQLIKNYCFEDKFTIGLPILEEMGTEIAELLNKELPFDKDTDIVLLAHGSEDYDNHEYQNLSKLLREDMRMYLAEGNGDLESIIKDSKKNKIALFSLMFTCGHHYKEEVEQFVNLCTKYGKDYAVYKDSLGSLKSFKELLVNNVEKALNK